MDYHALPDGWRIIWETTPHQGETWFERHAIRLQPGMPWRVERCVLQHEVVHAERGRFWRRCRAREEVAVQAEAAHRLIALDELADALAWSLWPDEVAEELDVDRSTLLARLHHLQRVELAYLCQRTEHHRAC